MSDDWQDNDEEWSEDEDWPDDLGVETYSVECASCGATVYEDAVACPSCGDYEFKSTRSSAFHGKPNWYLLLAALGIVAVILSLALPWAMF